MNGKKFIKNISIYRPNGSENLKYVLMVIVNYMKKLGLYVEIQTFKKKINSKVYTFTNLIGINTRSTGKFILLGAHTDSPQVKGCESAIDAATSIFIILDLAKKILLKKPNANLMLFFPDGEEYLGGKRTGNNTLSGSRYFINNFNLNLIKEVYILDLIGGDFDDKIILPTNNLNKIKDFYKLYKINKKYPKQIFVNPKFVSNVIRKTDHMPFLERGIDTLAIIPNNFPKNHHTIHDTFDNLNWEYISIFYKIMFEFFNYKFKIF